MPQPEPKRGSLHDALTVFEGRWTARGTSFGGTDQSGDPRANGEEWESRHTCFWHTGEFFLVQDERATVAGKPFDTLALIGVDEPSGDYFVRSIENHGYYRHYRLTSQGSTWTIDGETERATIEFVDNGRKQVIRWEWKPDGKWLPLCDRTAERTD